VSDFNTEEEYDNYLEYMEDICKQVYNIVYECKDIEALVKELENKMTRHKQDYSKVKRAEEIRMLSALRSEKDPVKLYSSKADVIEKGLSPAHEPFGSKNQPLVAQQNEFYNKKLPQLVETTVTFIRDKKLLVRAGGYDEIKIYEDLAKYAKLGLYD
jgi:hypothetical protein